MEDTPRVALSCPFLLSSFATEKSGNGILELHFVETGRNTSYFKKIHSREPTVLAPPMRSWHESWTGPETSEPSLTEKITHKVQNVQSKRPKTARSASVSKIRLAPYINWIHGVLHIITHFIIYNHSSPMGITIINRFDGKWVKFMVSSPPLAIPQAPRKNGPRHTTSAIGTSGPSPPANTPGVMELMSWSPAWGGAPPIWGWVKTLVPLVNIKIAGKWMFIPLKMVLIGIDP